MASSRNASNAVVVSVLQNVVSNQNQLKNISKKNHSLSKPLAGRLRRDPNSLQATLMAQNVIPNEDIEEFMCKQREKLKKLAETNIENERTLDTFMSAVVRIRQSIENSTAAVSSTEEGNPTMRNYEAMLQEMIEQAKQATMSTQIEINQETYYREICAEIGEELPPAAKKNKRAHGNNDEDDDIECVPTANSQKRSFKCPLTAQALEDPVKSKVCHHVYSKAAVTGYLRGGYKPCPVAGCSNQKLHQSQLEEDVEASILVRRQLRQEKSQALLRASQANQLESDEEEF